MRPAAERATEDHEARQARPRCGFGCFASGWPSAGGISIVATRQAWRKARRRGSKGRRLGSGAAEEQRCRRLGWSGGRQARFCCKANWRKARGAPPPVEGEGQRQLAGGRSASAAGQPRRRRPRASQQKVGGGRGRRRKAAKPKEREDGNSDGHDCATASEADRMHEEEVRRQDPRGLGSDHPDAGSHGRSGKENTKGHAAATAPCRSARRATAMRPGFFWRAMQAGQLATVSPLLVRDRGGRRRWPLCGSGAGGVAVGAVSAVRMTSGTPV